VSHSFMLVVGTRPEAIKLAPLARALHAQGVTPVVVLTGSAASSTRPPSGSPAFQVSGCAARPKATRGSMPRA
jgi:hypothetical protein